MTFRSERRSASAVRRMRRVVPSGDPESQCQRPSLLEGKALGHALSALPAEMDRLVGEHDERVRRALVAAPVSRNARS